MVTRLSPYLLLDEPELRFHVSEKEYKSANPIAGLKAWGPYDASVPGCLRPNPLRLAMLCPTSSFQAVLQFLKRLSAGVAKSASSKDEYVVDWPGFRSIFQTNIEFPNDPDSHLVLLVPDDKVQAALGSTQPEITFIETLKTYLKRLLPLRHEFDVLIVYIPARWALFRERHSEEYDFDLHDALKVFGAPNNLAIQIIEEDHACSNPEQARVMWWLGLALYVKGGGVPWRLVDPSPDTAFVGLSYGISHQVGNTGGRIVMGCSQVFDEHGEGLKFLLHPVENPILFGKRKNPFMSREDARRLFDRVREIYQLANDRRPSRVVVHKTTQFTAAEMEGIATALSGIDEIELIQIQDNTKWRAIAFDDKKQEVSGFPLRRGTVLPLDKYSFLLWTQGDLPNITHRNRHFYQEKRGIPPPLLIRRFRGRAPLDQLAREVLKLTKMNWNNHQVYNRRPVTLTFSDELADISKQVTEIWKTAYDFRFFM
jgi:hypothetical protein